MLLVRGLDMMEEIDPSQRLGCGRELRETYDGEDAV